MHLDHLIQLVWLGIAPHQRRALFLHSASPLPVIMCSVIQSVDIWTDPHSVWQSARRKFCPRVASLGHSVNSRGER